MSDLILLKNTAREDIDRALADMSLQVKDGINLARLIALKEKKFDPSVFECIREVIKKKKKSPAEFVSIILKIMAEDVPEARQELECLSTSRIAFERLTAVMSISKKLPEIF